MAAIHKLYYCVFCDDNANKLGVCIKCRKKYTFSLTSGFNEESGIINGLRYTVHDITYYINPYGNDGVYKKVNEEELINVFPPPLPQEKKVVQN
jgi:hypothetical protein